jgi:hypothetical protein
VHDALKDEHESQRAAPTTARRAKAKERLRIVAATAVTVAAVGSLIAALGGGPDAGPGSNPQAVERPADAQRSSEVTTDDSPTTPTSTASGSGRGAAGPAQPSDGREPDRRTTDGRRTRRAEQLSEPASRGGAAGADTEVGKSSTSRPRHTSSTTRRPGTTTSTTRSSPPATEPPATEPPATTPTMPPATTPPATDPPPTTPEPTVDTTPQTVPPATDPPITEPGPKPKRDKDEKHGKRDG